MAGCSPETTVVDKSEQTPPPLSQNETGSDKNSSDKNSSDKNSSDKNSSDQTSSDEAKAGELLSLIPDAQNIPPVFASLGDCEKSGASLPSCTRAQNIAKVMAQLDAPKFSNEKLCTEFFQNCTQVEGKFFPQAVSFGLGGNVQSQPTETSPTEIMPVYMNNKGVPVVLRSSVEGLYVMQPTDQKTAPFTFKPN